MSEGDDASTPLDPNEATGLRLAYVSTRAELNEAEALNIEVGLRWAGRGRSLDEVLDVSFLRELHRRMFGDVWGWAGSYRRTPKNLGIDWWHIPVAVDELVRDAAAWCTAGPSGWSIDEIGARFHHRLVSIHPFPNGNGRMSRAAAEAGSSMTPAPTIEIGVSIERPTGTVWAGTASMTERREQFSVTFRHHSSSPNHVQRSWGRSGRLHRGICTHRSRRSRGPLMTDVNIDY